MEKIEDENQFREYIWENIICKKEKRYSDLINDIVFSRARNLSVGVSADDYDKSDINELISDGILVKNLNYSSIKIRYV